jgi:trehalose/maltose hydrolase-like predicted phosphorylase
LADRHVLALEYSIYCEQTTELVLETGIDTQIWNINRPHLNIEEATRRDGIIIARCATRELGRRLVLAETIVWDGSRPEENGSDGYLRRYRFRIEAGQTRRFRKYATLFTGSDAIANPEEEAVRACRQAARTGFAVLLNQHATEWENCWREADAQIEGDADGQFALRYSLYHLLAIAPAGDRLSIPARGLSGQVYKGAVFWDTEMFMAPFFLNTMPHIAKNLLLYRYHTLDGARRKAKEY